MHWVCPKVVVEVTYLTWTEGGLLRAVSHQGQRRDKFPTEMVGSSCLAEDIAPMDQQGLISDIGITLWGPDWQQQLPSRLRVRPGTLAEWLTGRTLVPAEVWKELREMVRQSALQLADFDPRIVAAYDAAYQREMKRRP